MKGIEQREEVGSPRRSPSIRATGFNVNKRDKPRVREPGVAPDKEEEAGPACRPGGRPETGDCWDRQQTGTQCDDQKRSRACAILTSGHQMEFLLATDLMFLTYFLFLLYFK